MGALRRLTSEPGTDVVAELASLQPNPARTCAVCGNRSAPAEAIPALWWPQPSQRTALIPHALDGLDPRVRPAGLDRDLHAYYAGGPWPCVHCHELLRVIVIDVGDEMVSGGTAQRRRMATMVTDHHFDAPNGFKYRVVGLKAG